MLIRHVYSVKAQLGLHSWFEIIISLSLFLVSSLCCAVALQIMIAYTCGRKSHQTQITIGFPYRNTSKGSHSLHCALWGQMLRPHSPGPKIPEITKFIDQEIHNLHNISSQTSVVSHSQPELHRNFTVGTLDVKLDVLPDPLSETFWKTSGMIVEHAKGIEIVIRFTVVGGMEDMFENMLAETVEKVLVGNLIEAKKEVQVLLCFVDALFLVAGFPLFLFPVCLEHGATENGGQVFGGWIPAMEISRIRAPGISPPKIFVGEDVHVRNRVCSIAVIRYATGVKEVHQVDEITRIPFRETD